MWAYLLLFFCVVAMYFMQKSEAHGMSQKSFTGIMLFLALFVGFSDMLGGYDRYIYGDLFDGMADSRILGISWTHTELYRLYQAEAGYVLFNYAVSFITANRYIFILIVTCMTYWLFYKGFLREAKDYGLALILFLALYFFFTFTYLRQAMAVGIVFFSYRYIEKKELWKFLLCMAIAYTFHNSSILFLPMYWLSGRIPSKRVVLVLAVVCFAIGISGYPSKLFDLYATVTDESARMHYYDKQSQGFRVEYIIESTVFISYLFYMHDKIGNSRRDKLLYNGAIGFCLILMLFCLSLNGGRLSWVFMPALICCLAAHPVKSMKLSLRNLSLVGLSLLLYIRILLGWGVMLSPYKTFFTPGHREGDYIYAHYEYDQRYDIDKFYR